MGWVEGSEGRVREGERVRGRRREGGVGVREGERGEGALREGGREKGVGRGGGCVGRVRERGEVGG